MRKSMLLAAVLAMQLTVAAPVMAQDGSDAGVSVGGVTEDGFVRTSNDTLVDCNYYLSEGGQYEEACREAGFSPEEPGGAETASQEAALGCADFASREEAQAALDADPSDPNGLDADGDGLACEEVFAAPPTQAEETQDLDCVGLLEMEANPEQGTTSPEGAQARAQPILAEDPTDPDGLDADGDGAACEFEQSPTGEVAFEDGTGFVETVTAAAPSPQTPQQYAAPAPIAEVAPVVAPSEALGEAPAEAPSGAPEGAPIEAPSGAPEGAPIEAPSGAPDSVNQPTESGAVTLVTPDAALQAKQPSPAGRSSSLTELPATGGDALPMVASTGLLGGAALVSLGGGLMLAARRGRAS